MTQILQTLAEAILAVAAVIFTLATFLFAEAGKGRHWTLCPKCQRWFDWKGRATTAKPFVCRFKLYAEDSCPQCSTHTLPQP